MAATARSSAACAFSLGAAVGLSPRAGRRRCRAMLGGSGGGVARGAAGAGPAGAAESRENETNELPEIT